MDGMGGFMFPGLGIIILVIIIVAVAWAVKAGLAGNSSQTAHTEDEMSQTPLEILKRRYAKGEITKEQYQEMKEDLV
jgi:putative membrane protein